MKQFRSILSILSIKKYLEEEGFIVEYEKSNVSESRYLNFYYEDPDYEETIRISSHKRSAYSVHGAYQEHSYAIDINKASSITEGELLDVAMCSIILCDDNEKIISKYKRLSEKYGNDNTRIDKDNT